MFGHFLGDTITPKQKSLIDRCVGLTYRKLIASNYTTACPTLLDFVKILKAQTEPEAQDIVLAIELYTSGTLGLFAKPTNVDLSNRILCFNIRKLEDHLKEPAIKAILDIAVNRIARNRQLKKSTWLYIDEVSTLFTSESSRRYLSWIWARVRKLGGICTAITQHISRILRTEDAAEMLANCEFLVILNQFFGDADLLGDLLSLSDMQQERIVNASVGHGLIRFGKALIPFESEMDRETQLYAMYTTKMDESL
jgi:type IV secretory pathway VirB4 component